MGLPNLATVLPSLVRGRAGLLVQRREKTLSARSGKPNLRRRLRYAFSTHTFVTSCCLSAFPVLLCFPSLEGMASRCFQIKRRGLRRYGQVAQCWDCNASQLGSASVTSTYDNDANVIAVSIKEVLGSIPAHLHLGGRVLPPRNSHSARKGVVLVWEVITCWQSGHNKEGPFFALDLHKLPGFVTVHSMLGVISEFGAASALEVRGCDCPAANPHHWSAGTRRHRAENAIFHARLLTARYRTLHPSLSQHPTFVSCSAWSRFANAWLPSGKP
jgi:hypothetical protein